MDFSRIKGWLAHKKTDWFIPAVLILCILFLYAFTTMEKESDQEPQEERLAHILQCVEGAGKVEVMINRDEEQKIVGVIVAAEGAQNLHTRLCFCQSVATVLQISMDQIEILPMKEES